MMLSIYKNFREGRDVYGLTTNKIIIILSAIIAMLFQVSPHHPTIQIQITIWTNYSAFGKTTKTCCGKVKSNFSVHNAKSEIRSQTYRVSAVGISTLKKDLILNQIRRMCVIRRITYVRNKTLIRRIITYQNFGQN